MRSRDFEFGELLQRYTFVVPNFQRSYSWKAEQIEDFWQDLLARKLERDARHFVGTMVVQVPDGENDAAIVWDGQQRLATTVILLSAVRDYCLLDDSDPSAVDIANDLHRRYISKGGVFETAKESLRLGKSDRETFGALVLRKKGDSGRKDLSFFLELSAAVRRQDWSPAVISAYDFFAKELTRLLEADGLRESGWQQTVRDLMMTLLRRFDVIVAEAADANDAFMTFQTLNDRGLGLSAADLLKNFFLSETADQDARTEVAEQWEEMAQSLGGEIVPTYLRHFYMSKYGLVSRPRLYKTMVALSKPDTEGHRTIEPEQLLRDISEHGDVYLRLVRPSLEPTSWTNPGLQDGLHVLEALKATQWSPVGLAARMIGASEATLSELVALVESLIVREIVVIGRNPNAFEKVFATAAQTLWNEGQGRDSTREAAISLAEEGLASEFSAPHLFQAAFDELSLSTSRARVLLDRMERTLQRETYGGARPDLQVLDIEHIYPKTDTTDWPSPSDSDFTPEEDRNRIGNLTLLHYSLNRSQRNQSFDLKRGRFAQSRLLLTQPLGDESAWPDWGLEAIRRRQTILLGIAERTWPLPPGAGRSRLVIPDHEPTVLEPIALEDVLHAYRERIVGKAVNVIAAELGIPASASKSYAANVIRKALQSVIPGESFDALAGGSPTIRVPRVDADKLPYESISFPAFSHVELANEDWGTSSLRPELERMLFAPVFGPVRETPAQDCTALEPREWRPSTDDLEVIHIEWTRYRDLIRDNRSDDLPTEAETTAIHVRPHGRDATDRDTTAQGSSQMRKSFWLNKRFVQRILQQG